MSVWNPTAVKAQLRLTSQRLGQIQEKKDSQGSITRRDIATLLQQGDVALARVKAQNLIKEDTMGDLLEVLEMYVGIILEKFADLENSIPSPALVEAASSIIFAASYTDSKDLQVIRDILVQRFGSEFTRASLVNRDGHVSPAVAKFITTPPPTATKLDAYMSNIARVYGIAWAPGPQRQDMLDPISVLLDFNTSPTVDMVRLREVCSQGIPEEPSWLRPRIWKLFLGFLPALKASWKTESESQRMAYYDLVRRLLTPFHDLPPPSLSRHRLDTSLLKIFSQLNCIPAVLFDSLDQELEILHPGPLHEASPDWIPCSLELDKRLSLINERKFNEENRNSVTPEIRLETDDTPEITDSGPYPSKQTTLVASRQYATNNAHRQHQSALLRLLYIHSTINPKNLSPHVPSLLVLVYSVLTREIEPEELAHVEADTFWLFETVIGEFSELEEEEGGKIWMKKFSQRLQWADQNLWDNISAKGLDPALPHYSYQWLAPLLTHTISLPSILLVWDLLLSRNARDRHGNPKLECLVDVCTAMLIRAKGPLLRLGKGGRQSPSLWTEEDESVPPPSPLRSWEMDNAFMEGISLLRLYPLEAAGGIERILQTASDLALRRNEEAKRVASSPFSFGERLKVTMWKGITNQVDPVEDSPDESGSSGEEEEVYDDDGNETETPSAPAATGITAKLANTVWRGITNQSAMEPPPTPLEPTSPQYLTSQPPLSSLSPSATSFPSADVADTAGANIWRYADKLRESDAASAFSRVSSKWGAKTLLGSWGLPGQTKTESVSSQPVPTHRPTWSESRSHSISKSKDERRGSLPGSVPPEKYSPPPKPAFFKAPRDSWLPPPRPTSPVNAEGKAGERGSHSRRSSLLPWTSVPTTATETVTSSPKPGPRPLLLGAGPVVSGQRVGISRSANATPSPDSQWNEVMRAKAKALNRDSVSSTSSLSPADALSRIQLFDKTGWESDQGGSRKVALNRRSISPMAPLSRRVGSPSSISSDRSSLLSHQGGNATASPQAGWAEVIPDSSPSNSPPGPRTPHLSMQVHDPVLVKEQESTRGSIVLNDFDPAPLYPTPPIKAGRKKIVPQKQDETSDSTIENLSRVTRVRSKKYPRLANINIQQDVSRTKTIIEKTSPGSLGVEWPRDELEGLTTPRASSFDTDETPALSPRRVRKVSTDGQPRSRKTSNTSKGRKVSPTPRHPSRGSADEGDDEGYDDLLSAYESEEGSATTFLP